MKTTMIAALALLGALMLSPLASADQWVNGYTRSDGTHVRGYYRTDPNQYRYDNYSSRGNVNPYTGQRGSQRNEFTNPPAYNKSYGGGSGIYNNRDHSSSRCYSSYGC